MKKGQIEELLDSDGNLIGNESLPQYHQNAETGAKRTTDYNAKVGSQNFKNDFLGRFGFYFYESDQKNEDLLDGLAKVMYSKYLETLEHYKNNPEKLESDWEMHQNTDFENQPEGSKEHDYEWAEDILKYLEPHLKKDLNEGVVVEDKVSDSKSDKSIGDSKKPKDISSKLEKVAELLSKLPKYELNKLTTLLETKSDPIGAMAESIILDVEVKSNEQ